MHLVFKITLLIFFVLLRESDGQADPHVLYPVLPWDGSPWKLEPLPEGTLAIADIHGDLDALVHIMQSLAVINTEGGWIGGQRRVILLGDVLGRGKDYPLLVLYMMRLEQEAPRHGGGFHWLIGNHDLKVLEGDLGHISTEAAYAFRGDIQGVPYLLTNSRLLPWDGSVLAAFRVGGVFEGFLHHRNAMLQVGDTLVVHAGVDDSLLEATPGEINTTVREWTDYYHGKKDKMPPEDTAWVLGLAVTSLGIPIEQGPLWTRRMAKVQVNPKIIQAILSAYGIRYIVAGHTTVAQPQVLYEGSVYLMDSGNSCYVRVHDPMTGGLGLGKLSAWENKDDKVTIHTMSHDAVFPAKRLRQDLMRDWQAIWQSHHLHEEAIGGWLNLIDSPDQRVLHEALFVFGQATAYYLQQEVLSDGLVQKLRMLLYRLTRVFSEYEGEHVKWERLAAIHRVQDAYRHLDTKKKDEIQRQLPEIRDVLAIDLSEKPALSDVVKKVLWQMQRCR